MHDYANESAKLNDNKTKEWIYGILLHYPAKIIMKAIYEVLNQMNTVKRTNFIRYLLFY